MIEKAINHLELAAENLAMAAYELTQTARTTRNVISKDALLGEAEEAKRLAALIRPEYWGTILRRYDSRS